MKFIRLSFKNLFSVFPILLLMASYTANATEMLWAIPKPDASENRSTVLLKSELRKIPSGLENTFTPKIVGGAPAPRGAYPEYTSLWVDGLDGYIYFLCGSTLISSNRVLTAAHCTINYPASRLYVIPNYYSHNDSISSSQIYGVNSRYIHSSYSSSTNNNDISILALNKNASTKRAKIYGGSDQLAGSMSTIIGLGLLSEGGSAPSVLYKANVPVVSNSACKNSYGSSNIKPSMLCAGYASGGTDACQGDSGGPLFVTINGQRVQAGITSWGIGCARPKYYGVFARTSALINFVRQYAPAAVIITDSATGFLPSVYLMLLSDDD